MPIHESAKLPALLFTISVIMGLIVLVVGVTVFSYWIYGEIIYIIVGLMILVFSGIGVGRVVRAREIFRVGEACITHGWWVFSSGLGGIMVYIAPFFTKGAPQMGVIALLSSTIAAILGLATVMYARSKLKVSLTI